MSLIIKDTHNFFRILFAKFTILFVIICHTRILVSRIKIYAVSLLIFW